MQRHNLAIKQIHVTTHQNQLPVMSVHYRRTVQNYSLGMHSRMTNEQQQKISNFFTCLAYRKSLNTSQPRLQAMY